MRLVLFFILLGAFAMTSCKSQFEKVRTSSDPKTIYEEALKYYKEGEFVKAQTLFELAIPFYRGKKEAEELFFKYAFTYYELDEFIMASHYFDNFSKTFYNSAKKEEASYLSAFSNYKMSPNFRLDQTYSDKSVEGLQTFINLYPNSTRVAKCNQLIDEIRAKKEQKAFYNAELYFNLKRYKSAIQSFENMLKEFPDSKEDEKIRYLLIEANFLLAENSVFEKKEKRYQNTIKYYEAFHKKYPSSRRLKKGKKMYKTCKKLITELEEKNGSLSKN